MPKISQLTEKTTTPSDTDLKVIVESSTNTTKKITWATIKNALKTFFDTVYAQLTDFTTHQSSSGGVHGITGEVVGTTDEQTLSNKNVITGINTQTGTAYTLVLSDAGKLVQMDNASANTVTIPANSSVAFPIGTKIMIQKYGTGDTTIQGAAGVTVRDPLGIATITIQYDARVIIKEGVDEWLIQ
ncbi:MAG: hypothetical protein KatS3mg096_744 [Candidatus Parcubacteria bacterium]|nr:MAG: hypothetical protein KatS3mg096_744 [Candidatus Parcubacteria bacterium]